MYDAHGFLSASIKIVEMGQARENILLNMREDLEGQVMESPASMPSIPPAVGSLANTLSENEDVLQSLGTVISKIKRIADVTVDMVDALAKVKSTIRASSEDMN